MGAGQRQLGERARGILDRFFRRQQTAYLLVQNDVGPDSVVALDVASGARREVFRDDDTSPSEFIYSYKGHPIGVTIMDGIPHNSSSTLKILKRSSTANSNDPLRVKVSASLR